MKSIRSNFFDVNDDFMPIEIKPAVKLSKQDLFCAHAKITTMVQN